MSFYGTANVSGMVSEERVRNYVNGNPLVEKWKAKRVKHWCDQKIKESDADGRKKKTQTCVAERTNTQNSDTDIGKTRNHNMICVQSLKSGLCAVLP